MRRASASRRADHVGSPGPRSRSQERSMCSSPQPMPMAPFSEEEDSERIGSLRDGSHRRAMSDPFDVTEDDEFPQSTNGSHNDILPTLPRFPVAETRDLNCWSEPSVNIFHVRGPAYFADKKKVTSGPYLLRARGCDLLLADDPPKHIGSNPSILGGALRKAPTFIINFRFPWGVLVHYFEIPEKFCPYLRPNPPTSMNGMTPAEKTLAQFFLGDDRHRNSTLKLIPYVAEGPWIVRNMVTGKPAIIGNKLPVSYFYEPAANGLAEYLEADLDIGSSSNTAKRIVSVCRRYMNALTVDIGFVIQGNTEAELPEQMLASIRIHGVDPVKAPKLSY